jgi:hypothetical protein
MLQIENKDRIVGMGFKDGETRIRCIGIDQEERVYRIRMVLGEGTPVELLINREEVEWGYPAVLMMDGKTVVEGVYHPYSLTPELVLERVAGWLERWQEDEDGHKNENCYKREREIL